MSIFIIAYLIILGKEIFGLETEEIKLPEEKKEAYVVTENKINEKEKEYILKVKLNLKVNDNTLILGNEKFHYPLKNEKIKEKFLSLIRTINPELVKVDENVFCINDFEGLQDFEDLERGILSKKIELAKGKHNYEKLENPVFDVEWAVLEPDAGYKIRDATQEPEIIFKKINPTKYLVKVKGAEEPFWLVFSESFHEQWRIYHLPDIEYKLQDNIVAEYPKWGVKESEHLMKFTPQDIKFLFKKPLGAQHHLVNGYANGWYVEPNKLGLPEDFTLIIYFWPQSLFYLGLGISGITLIGCIFYLMAGFKRKRNKKQDLKYR